MQIKFGNGSTLDILTYSVSSEYLEIQIIDQSYDDVIGAFFNHPDICADMTIGDDYFADYTLRKYTVEDTYKDINKAEHVRITIRMYQQTVNNTLSKLNEKIEALRLEKEALSQQVGDAETKITAVEQQLSPAIDTDPMSVEEYRSYKKSLVGEACRKEIYNGIHITIDGKNEHFTYKEDDQNNFSDMLLQLYCGLQTIPYHNSSTGNITNPCKNYTAGQILEIYIAQSVNKLQLTTKCNQIYIWLDELTDKESMESITFFTPLPQKQQNAYDSILQEVDFGTLKNTIMEKLISKNECPQTTP